MRLIDADEFERRCMFSKSVHDEVDDDGLYAVLEELRKTPAIDTVPVKWIPVTERLPEYNEMVLVTVVLLTGTFTMTDTYSVKYGKFLYWQSCVTAWMPLPEPYKGDEHDT